MNHSPTILIATGASGGHMFPALSVAKELSQQKATCVFVVGGGKFTHLVTDAGYTMERLPASALNVRNPIRKIKGIFNLLRAFVHALRLVQKHQPAAIFGTGGYATVALVLAGKLSGVPTIIHEQNVLPGRANKFLAKWADYIFITFEKSREFFNTSQRKIRITGYPLRHELLSALNAAQPRSNKTFNILVIGGSQGARILSQILPEATARLSTQLREKLSITHQVRSEDEALLTEKYSQQNLGHFETKPFINNMSEALNQAHLVISRSGTGGLAEISIFGRAAIYVPLTLADGHQMLNAQIAEAANAAIILDQPLFTPENLSHHIKSIIEDPLIRDGMENNAKTLFPQDGAKKTATAVMTIAQNDVMQQQ